MALSIMDSAWVCKGERMAEAEGPRGEVAIRTAAMPADTNAAGDIFGGWLLAQMDIAGGITATARAEGRVVTSNTSSSNVLAMT